MHAVATIIRHVLIGSVRWELTVEQACNGLMFDKLPDELGQYQQRRFGGLIDTRWNGAMRVKVMVFATLTPRRSGAGFDGRSEKGAA